MAAQTPISNWESFEIKDFLPVNLMLPLLPRGKTAGIFTIKLKLSSWTSFLLFRATKAQHTESLKGRWSERRGLVIGMVRRRGSLYLPCIR